MSCVYGGMLMRRRGFKSFALRFFRAFGNGLLIAKVRRHVFRLGLVRRAVSRWCSRKPLCANKVVFTTFAGTCSCNPKYIALELAKCCPEADIVWLLGAAEYRMCKGKPVVGRAVPYWTLRAFSEISTAVVLVDNAQGLLMAGMPPKREGQFYINTWHGSLGIKRLDTASSEITERIARMSAYDVVLTNSDFEEAVFRSSFFPNSKLLRAGHPRNDVFFLPAEDKAAIRRRVKKALGITESEHIALFAPTFREDAFASQDSLPDFKAWARACEDRFGGTWKVALRLHPHDAKALSEGLFSLPQGVLDLSSYPDMQELLLAVDVGITDYSSWIFDFLLGGGPGFIYAPDKSRYDEARGFYYPLEETPFPIAKDEESLCLNLRAFDQELYGQRMAEFLKARGCMEDGMASAHVSNIICDRMPRGTAGRGME